MNTQKYQEFIRNMLGGKVIAYYPILAKSLGGAKNAVMLSQLIYWSNNRVAKKRGGWFYKSVEEFCDETGLTKDEQRTARNELARLGVIETKLTGRVPRTWHYKVNIEAIVESIPHEFLDEDLDLQEDEVD